MLALHLAAASDVVAKNHYGGTAIVGCAWPDPTLSTVWDGGWQMHVNVDHWKAFHHVTIDFPLPIVIRDAWGPRAAVVVEEEERERRGEGAATRRPGGARRDDRDVRAGNLTQ